LHGLHRKIPCKFVSCPATGAHIEDGPAASEARTAYRRCVVALLGAPSRHQTPQIQPLHADEYEYCYNVLVIDIQKQIHHWRTGAIEDWQVALELADLGRTRHCLFFAHLAVEKTLKAHICRVTDDLAPRIHALLRLAEMATLNLSQDQLDFLARFDRYQLEGRYPDMLPPAPDSETTQEELQQAGEVLQWLNAQF
jgi:HEPN domain-containing protein